jgi:EmrB/QacA subfamily drug resistance transporter
VSATAGIDDEPAERRQRIAVATVYVAAMFISILDSTVVNVALPAIARDFTVPVEHTASINIGYLVAVAVAIPVSGWLGDRLGARGVFVTAVGLFTAASAACGLAGSLAELSLFRIFQGAAGGMMTPVGMAMLYRTFPPAQRIRLGRITTVPIGFAPALGPVIGGLLTEHVGWRWIFGINVPIGAIAVLFTVLAVRPLERTTRHRLDVAGFLLAGGGFGGLMYAVSQGPTRGWTTPDVLVAGLSGLALLAMLIPVELRSATPMLQLRLFRLRLFRSANLIALTFAAGFVGALFAYPLMLQNGLGLSPLTSGLLTFPEAIGVMFGTQIAGTLYSRVGPRGLVAAGQCLVMAMLVCLALVLHPGTPTMVPVVLMFVLGIGQAHTFMPVQAAAFDSVPRPRTGEASSLYNVTRQAGGAIGVALSATVIAAVALPGASSGAAADLTPFRAAILACAACNLIAALISWLTVHNEDAAPSRGLAPRPD